jgi:aromatic ring-opening dioxygenase catalytic subunit (LigB family)
MMSLVAATMLSMAAMKADPMDNARKAFNNCMIEVHNKAVGEKVSPSNFLKTAESACTAERTTYHDMMVKAERGYGSSQKDAEAYANEEVQMMVDGIVSSFNENAESGAKLTPEK